MTLPKVNIIENIAQNKNLFSMQVIEEMHCEPRPPPKQLGNRQFERDPWEFKKSAFASYKHDTPKLIEQCFETDWNRSKVHRVVKDEKERELMKKYMRTIYKHFRNMYKFTAG